MIEELVLTFMNFVDDHERRIDQLKLLVLRFSCFDVRGNRIFHSLSSLLYLLVSTLIQRNNHQAT